MENKIKSVFTAPLNFMNPVLVQVLGICSALAVTSQLKPALVMGLAVTMITAFSNLIISLIRNTVPTRIRIVVQLVVVAALVTIVSMGAIREKMQYSDVPKPLQGLGISFIVVGLMAIAMMCFSGLKI